jgi:MFS family permease
MGSRKNIFELISEWVGFLRRQENPFKVNILKNLAQRFANSMTYQYQSIYITELGASPSLLGYIGSISGVVNTLLAIPAGLIADRIGIKNVFMLTLTMSIVNALIFGFASTWQIAAIAMVLATAVMTLDRTVCPMICGSSLASSERVTGMGICDTVSFLPNLIAPLVGAYLITIFGGMNVEGIRPLYYIQVIGLIIAIIILYTKFENPKLRQVSRGDSGLIENLRTVLSKGKMIKRWILMVMFLNFSWGAAFYVPLFAKMIKNADQFIIGGMSTASTIVLVFLAIPIGLLADTRARAFY